MKQYFLFFCTLVLAGTLYLTFPLKEKEHFVSLDESKGFILDDKPFYPVTINYLANLQADEQGNIWVSSFNGYAPAEKFRFVTKDSSLMLLKAEMDLIREMGFNSIRLVRVGEEIVDEKNNGALSISARVNNERDIRIPLDEKEGYPKYLKALDEFFEIADKAGLKVIFLVNVQPDVPSTDSHIRIVAEHFKDANVIMAYDLFNEPLYFDPKQRDKKEVYEITHRWRNILDSYAPNHLFTIGLEGIREVFEWDPNVIDVDFVSLHPYQYEPEQVRNEIYWYGKYIKKPWVVGETAIPADNDSVSYDTQLLFAKQTLQRARDCGSFGYSWWQYKDVNWNLFHANYMGVVNWAGQTQTKAPNIPIIGTVKPLAKAFQTYNPEVAKQPCDCYDNYYNYSKDIKRTFRLTGQLVDDDDQPIEGGVVLGWNETWTHSYHTVSKADGTFEMLTDYPVFHWMTSATEYKMIRGELNPDTAKVVSGSALPTIRFGKQVLNALKFNH